MNSFSNDHGNGSLEQRGIMRKVAGTEASTRVGSGGPGVSLQTMGGPGARGTPVAGVWSGRPMMLKFQPTLSLVGASGTGDVEQPFGGWLDGLQYPTFHVKAEVSAISGCTVLLESAAGVEGPWTTVKAYTQVGDSVAVISSEGGELKFNRFVRWRVNPGGAAWFTCFKFQAMPGKSISDVVLTPRRT